MLQAAYESAWHHPGVAWLMALALVVAVLATRPRLLAFLLGFAIEIALDAYFSAPFAPKLPASLGTAVAVAFVILGDYRYFVVLEGALAGGFDKARAWLVALPWAFVVPVASTIARQIAPKTLSDDRTTYLVYELMFFALAIGVRAFVLPRRAAALADETRRWLSRVTAFEIVQYGLWALADVVILAGASEPGYLLRIAPNVLYYGGFLFFVWRTAPAALRDGPSKNPS